METIQAGPEQLGKSVHARGNELLIIGQPITGNWIHKKVYGSCIGVMNPMTMIDLFATRRLETMVRIINDFPIDYNRNNFVDYALAAGADYLMFMDMDMTFPPRMFQKLFETISDDRPVVCGMYYLKKEPFSPVLGRYVDWDEKLLKGRKHLEDQGFVLDDGSSQGKQLLMWKSISFFDPEGGPFQVDAIGMGCVLVKTSIFQKLSRPYFRYSYDPDSGDKAWLKLSEDMYWCAQLKKAGIPIYCDPRVQCGHIMEMESNVDLYFGQREACLAATKEKDPEGHKNLVDNVMIDVREEQKRNSANVPATK